ncbi:S-adenosyl-L-methionine-dependent tRNA 4-demethylwyosine synthase TYW1 [Lepeophtheirus salmonis]|uniref:S-adenosyl-L-methionine-dependent tRNA 4-demethylwyosine synthase TYW1 n=1 Tax=Lepeophtheirus salmonis TaxID=72036 RepID=UPI001AE72D93|nr:S-adenosyl-L-methionine-dependent tRNA 4-demethylwyosine synthase TYW1-like [Lepeophtheirus salmonis]
MIKEWTLIGPLTIPLLIVIAVISTLILRRRKSSIPIDISPVKKAKEETQTSCCGSNDCCGNDSSDSSIKKIKVIYGSEGVSKELALSIKNVASDLSVEILSSKDYYPGDEILTDVKETGLLVVVIISTYTEGLPPPDAKYFYSWFEEEAKDFRVQHTILKGLKYCVYGLGHSGYGKEYYNVTSRNLDKFFRQLSAESYLPLSLSDENDGTVQEEFNTWSKALMKKIKGKQNGLISEAGKETIQDSDTDEEYSDEEEEENEEDDGLVDMEDMGVVMKKAKEFKNSAPKDMVTPTLRKSLTKQGYKIIGTHSGVKICRWTKAMLRGRGGCYKHTFYGIESHRCMETTPSLACANKCVFCWRHHSNPVGTEWKWSMDPPDMILDGALENHYKMIKQMKGVPGVLPEKLAEGMDVQHCALSLVGEPIMYPEINQFVRLLHSKSISSFLVTNAQFPDAIASMDPCTQLYVSIDASTKESLKKIDRPLFKDFWERFIQSLKELSHKGQRTVYRLTLVKGFNVEELHDYAKLVALGRPDFIEIKGVTYCGTSKASTLTMENVPWHEEVVNFSQTFADMLEDYEISCEHEHSNCILVSHKKFHIDGEWKTWIDYKRFHELVSKFDVNDPSTRFTASDYMVKTPDWAVYGAVERGFNPSQTRVHRKGKKGVKSEAS